MENEKKPTREEIVRSLRWCSTCTDGCSGGCAFEPECDEDVVVCVNDLCGAAADLIDELTGRCARYAEEIMVLKEQLRKYRLAKTMAARQNEKGCPLARWCDAVQAAKNNNEKEKQA